MTSVPELPEVETIARGLRALLVGRTIANAEVLWPRSIEGMGPAEFVQRLRGRRITGVGRRGKWLVIHLAPGQAGEEREGLLVHLRMSGRLLVESEPSHDLLHLRVRFQLDDGRWLSFYDTRKFGRLRLTSDVTAALADLGPEPLSEEFTIEQLRDLVRRKRGRIKSLLLDQRALAGLGNIYTDEALWRAGIHPLRSSASLTGVEVERLYVAIRQVLQEAVLHEGTTLSDQEYRGPDGRSGAFSTQLAVYRRAGQPCLRCGHPIERVVVSQRGTYLCPVCQRLD